MGVWWGHNYNNKGMFSWCSEIDAYGTAVRQQFITAPVQPLDIFYIKLSMLVPLSKYADGMER